MGHRSHRNEWRTGRYLARAGPSWHFRKRSGFGLLYLAIFGCDTGEFDPNCVIGTPHSVTSSDIIPSNLKQKFVWDRVGAHTCDFSATVREITQNAGTIQKALRVVDCCR
jgi:hypothetical protein